MFSFLQSLLFGDLYTAPTNNLSLFFSGTSTQMESLDMFLSKYKLPSPYSVSA